MNAPDPDQAEQDLFERDRATVLNCEHGVIEYTGETMAFLHGPATIEVITCLTCPTQIELLSVSDPRDDLYANRALGN